MAKQVYVVFHGSSVPFQKKECKTWQETQQFIKAEIDAGREIRTVRKETPEPECNCNWEDY